MDRRNLNLRGAIVVCCALLASVQAQAVRAQALDSLHVRRFVMSADTLEPHVGQPFRLTISAHVDEQIAELDNVTLPDLSGFQVQGDERGCTATQSGSDCSETVVLTPLAAGTVTIASTTMDAIDASDKKPSRFATNSLRLQIGNAPFSLGIANGGADLLWNTLRSFFLLLAAVVGIWFLLRYLARPRPPKPVPPLAAQPIAAAAPTAVPVADFDAHFRQLVEMLRGEPTRPRALAVRHALRYALGAHEKETLADLVRRNAAGDRPQRIAALRAIERACFCEDGFVASNVQEALPLLTI
jgi:hypothetical protein